MRILATLDLPNYGDALVDGFSSLNDPHLVRKRLGFMPDGFGAYAYTNVVEYLDFFARAFGLMGAERGRRLKHVLEFTQLKVLADKPIRGLSKGMRQRLCLGRALIHDPSVLVLDEPANGLDPRARIELRQMIRALSSEGKTVLVSSHILTELAEMCDMVAIVERGRLLAVGSVEEIRRSAAPVRRCTFRVVGGLETATAWFREHVAQADWTLTESQFKVAIHGGEREQADLLKRMILAGIDVVEASTESHTLEDVFLHVTKGIVQ